VSENLNSLFESLEPQVLATGFLFAEGPVWHPSGHLYFSDIRDSKRYRIDTRTKALELLAENTFGANGTTFNSNEELVYCQVGKRRVVGVSGTKETVFADSFDGKKLNGPNDIVPHSDGSLYFSNPEGWASADNPEIGYSGVYRVATPGEIIEVCAGMNLPNGLAFSPDESLLYVSNTRPDPKIYVFDMQADGTAGNQRVFAEFSLVDNSEKNGVPDGMKVDSAGRVYCTGPGGIWIWEPDGTQVGVLTFPEVATNIAWGGDDMRTMFVTGHSSVYSLRTTTPGIPLPVFK
jgi:gluconolactonase